MALAAAALAVALLAAAPALASFRPKNETTEGWIFDQSVGADLDGARGGACGVR